MLELSLKRLDILLDCSKDQCRNIAPWLACPEIYAHMLSTGIRGVVSGTRGCLLPPLWTPGRLDFPSSVQLLFCLLPFWMLLRFSLALAFSPLFWLLVSPQIKIDLIFVCALLGFWAFLNTLKLHICRTVCPFGIFGIFVNKGSKEF